MKRITLVILDYKNKKDTKECIASLTDLVLEDISLSVILVNNDTSEIYQEKEFPSKFPLKVINNKVNNGFSGGSNTGIHEALGEKADYIVLLNNDTVVEKRLLTELLAVITTDENIGLVSPKIYFAKGSEFHKEKYKKEDLGKVFWYAGGIMDWKNVLGKHRGVDDVDHGQFETTEETDFATGCCMMFRARLIKEVGIFDEKYFLYYEDSDFNQRVKKKGYKVMYVPKAVVWHKNAGSTGGSGSALQDYFITRNRLLFGMSYAPLRSKIALLKESLRILRNGRVWQKVGVKDYYMGKFGKGSYQIV
jgi:GT2 family glycosyltransferase